MNSSQNSLFYTPKDIEIFEDSKFCGICETPFRWKQNKQTKELCLEKVYHHDHAAIGTKTEAGKFICAAFPKCNLAAQRRKVLPCIFHISGFDDKMSAFVGRENVFITNFVTKSVHHIGSSCIIVLHNAFSPRLRTLALNTTYIVFFKQPRDNKTINFLGKQIFPNTGKFLSEAYKICT